MLQKRCSRSSSPRGWTLYKEAQRILARELPVLPLALVAAAAGLPL
ncbi:hypothetical protein LNP24_13495 [Klebsiella pneumoniae subsp. pneumoniae]|nr:hypothetical protein [Klebsiella pneumoniae subsp. pneumoniae]